MFERPVFTSPADAEYLRETTVERWTHPHHTAFIDEFMRSFNYNREEMVEVSQIRKLGMILSEAPLYALMQDAAILVQEAAKQMELQVLHKTDLPSVDGLLFFQYPIYITDVHEKQIPIIGILWKTSPAGLNIIYFTSTDDLQHVRDIFPPLSLLHLMGLKWDAIPRASASYPGIGSLVPEDALESHEALWRVIQAFWAFVQQQIIVSEPQEIPRPVRRRAEKLGRKRLGALRVVRLREIYKGSVEKRPGGDAIEWSHRWIVRGHWRWQFYPSIADRRQIWIHAFVKGPEDKPLLTRKTVFNVTR